MAKHLHTEFIPQKWKHPEIARYTVLLISWVTYFLHRSKLFSLNVNTFSERDWYRRKQTIFGSICKNVGICMSSPQGVFRSLGLGGEKEGEALLFSCLPFYFCITLIHRYLCRFFIFSALSVFLHFIPKRCKMIHQCGNTVKSQHNGKIFGINFWLSLKDDHIIRCGCHFSW